MAEFLNYRSFKACELVLFLIMFILIYHYDLGPSKHTLDLDSVLKICVYPVFPGYLLSGSVLPTFINFFLLCPQHCLSGSVLQMRKEVMHDLQWKVGSARNTNEI